MLFRTLGALGTLTALSDAVTAEGLFTSAIDEVDKAMHGRLAHALDAGRGPLWRSLVFSGFADLLEQGRQADQRKSEIAQLRDKAADALGIKDGKAILSRKQLRWASVYLPPPEHLDADELLSQRT